MMMTMIIIIIIMIIILLLLLKIPEKYYSDKDTSHGQRKEKLQFVQKEARNAPKGH